MKFTLDETAINDLVKEGMLEAIKTARHAHFTDIVFRINGEWKRVEADWIKYLEVQDG